MDKIDCYGDYDNDSKYCHICFDRGNCEITTTNRKGDFVAVKKKVKSKFKGLSKKRTLKKFSSKKSREKGKRAKRAASTKNKKQTEISRKDFILDMIRNAGKSGIELKEVVKATDSKFNYVEGRSSRMRVANTVKVAVNNGIVKRLKNGKVAYC